MRTKRTPTIAPVRYSWFRLLLMGHFRACLSSISRLSCTPFATLLTVVVIGVSLALPLGLFIIVQNAQTLSQQWNKGQQLSVFLKTGMSQPQIDEFLISLRLNPQIRSLQYISPENAMAEFQEAAGMKALLGSLPDNPLPGVVVVTPRQTHSTFEIGRLVAKLRRSPQVDWVQFDYQWVERLLTILLLLKRFVWAFASLLGLGVLLTISNTIRLATENYRRELEIIKLMGATNAFIRRPLLYAGIIFGVLGGVIAWLCVDFIILWLQGTITELSKLYSSGFQLSGLGIDTAALMILIGGGLGLLAAYVVISRELRSLP